MPASQKAIAQKLGISTAAVSLALSGKGSVSAELARKVRQTAEELGYRPNPMLSLLAASRFRGSGVFHGTAIAVLDFLGEGRRFLYREQIELEAERQGYFLTSYGAADLARMADASKTLFHRGVQGVIALGPLDRPLDWSGFDWARFSVVFCGRFYSSMPFVTVRPNIAQAVRESYRQAKARGYQRIGFALGRHDPIIEDDEERLATALALQSIDGAAAIPPFFGPISDLDGFAQWFRNYKPDAVVGFRYEYLLLLLEMGAQVPERVGYVNLHETDCRPFGADDPRAYSRMDQNRDLVAKKSLHMLDQNIRLGIRGQSAAPEQVLIPSTWVEGDTLRPLRD